MEKMRETAFLAGIFLLLCSSVIFGMQKDELLTNPTEIKKAIVKTIQNTPKDGSIVLMHSFMTDPKIINPLKKYLKDGGNVYAIVNNNQRNINVAQELASLGAVVTVAKDEHAKVIMSSEKDIEKTGVTSPGKTTVFIGSKNGSQLNHYDGVVCSQDRALFEQSHAIYRAREGEGKVCWPEGGMSDSPQKKLPAPVIMPQTPQKKSIFSSDQYDLNGFMKKQISKTPPHGYEQVITSSSMIVTDPAVLQGFAKAAQKGSVHMVVDGNMCHTKVGCAALEKLDQKGISVNVYNADRTETVFPGSMWAKINHFKGTTKKLKSPQGTEHYCTMISTGNQTESGVHDKMLVTTSPGMYEKTTAYIMKRAKESEKFSSVRKRLAEQFDTAMAPGTKKLKKS